MSGNERTTGDRTVPPVDEFVPAGVDDLVEYVTSIDAAVVVLRWVDGDQRRTEFAVDVTPVPVSTRSESVATVDVLSVDADPPVAHPVPVESIEAVRPVRDAETATGALPADPTDCVAVLRGLADHASALVDVTVVLATLDCDPREDASTVVDALACLASVARERPDDCQAAVPRVRALVSEAPDGDVQTSALSCLASLSMTRPADVTPHVAVVFPFLHTGGAPSAAPTAETATAVACVAHVASDDPTAVVDCASDLCALLDVDDPEVRMHAAYAIGRITIVAPEAVRPTVTRLVDVVGDETARTATRLNATCAAGRVAGTWPDAVVDHLTTFVDALDATDAGLRANAAGVVGDVAVTHAVVVRRHVTRLVDQLDDADGVTRTNVTTALARVAREFPESIADHVDRLVDCLDDEESLVRENACWALGYLRDEARSARSVLERLRLDDGDEQVRHRAGWALDEVNGSDSVGVGD